MPRKAPPEHLENAVRDYLDDGSFVTCAKRWGIDPHRLRRVLVERGLFRSKAETAALTQRRAAEGLAGMTAEARAARAAKMAHSRRAEIDARVDWPTLIGAYVGGESENSVAKRFGVDRGTVRKRLLDAGVQIRSYKAASAAHLATTTPAQRMAQVAAAHAAKRGVPNERDAYIRAALTRQANATPGSRNEALLLGMLKQRGLCPVLQFALGTYNLDVAIPPVAVEIHGGAWHGYGAHAARATERARYILDAGWNLLIVWINERRHPLGAAAADYAVAFLEQSERDPSLRGEYRVIRGSGEVMAVGRDDLDQLALVPARSRAQRRGA